MVRGKLLLFFLHRHMEQTELKRFYSKIDKLCSVQEDQTFTNVITNHLNKALEKKWLQISR